MTAHSGDSFSGDVIFPPFVPRAAQPAAPAPVPAPQPEPVAEATDEPEPWAAPEAEPIAAEAAAPAQAAEELPWETPATEPAEDLPWLEVSEPSAEAGADVDAQPVASADEDAAGAAEETVPDWLSWDSGAPAAAVTETPEIPPPGDVDASAAARDVAETEDVLQPMAGLESFDRDETAEVAPVDGLAPVGDFDMPAGEEEPGEPAAAYETPVWAQPSEEWAAPPADGEDPLLTATVPAPVADADAVVPDAAEGASADELDEPDAVGSALDAEVAALLDVPASPPVETAGPASDSPADVEAAVEPEVAAASTGSSLPVDDRLAAMLGEVAGRLESIARSLRERSPADVLAGPRDGDPLELLVTGFVLGYLQRGGKR